jgi:hypothetical protein
MIAACESHGLKLNRFIEDAILNKLEEMEDLEDLRKLRHESFRPLEQVVRDLKKRGKL